MEKEKRKRREREMLKEMKSETCDICLQSRGKKGGGGYGSDCRKERTGDEMRCHENLLNRKT